MKSLLHDAGAGPTPRFISGTLGRLFTLTFSPAELTQGTVIYLPPFAEEANKSRRMAALQARSLTELGFRVILLDLYGTGDSEGEFRDASWRVWKDDIHALLGETSLVQPPLSFWGLRMGCLLLADFLHEYAKPVQHCVFWQAIPLGQQLITQFLRVEMANSMMSENKVTPKDLREQIQQGSMVEVAGYELSPELVTSLDALKLVERPFQCGQLHCFEVVKQAGKSISPAMSKIFQQWSDMNIASETVVGDSFWTTQEIATVPELIQATQRQLRGS